MDKIYYDGSVELWVYESLKLRQDKIQYFLKKDRGVSEGDVSDIVNRYIRLTKLFKGSGSMNHLVWSGLGISEDELKFPNQLGSYRDFGLLKRVVEYLEMIKGVKVVQDRESESERVLGKSLKLVYSDSLVEVYLALSSKACIEIGENEKWCVSNSHLNFYYRYRFSPSAYTFYFVRVLQGGVEDRYKFFLIGVFQGEDGNLMYELSDRNNETDQLSWEGVVQRVPLLKSLKQVFKYVFYTSEEKEIHEKIYMRVNLLRKKLSEGFNSDEKVVWRVFEEVFPLQEFLKLTQDEVDIFLDMYMGKWFEVVPDAYYLSFSFSSKKRYISLIGDISSRAKSSDVFSNGELMRSKSYHIRKNLLTANVGQSVLKNVPERLYEPYFRGVRLSDFFENTLLDKVSEISDFLFDSLLLVYLYDYDSHRAFYEAIFKACLMCSQSNQEKVFKSLLRFSQRVGALSIVSDVFKSLKERVSSDVDTELVNYK